MKHVKKAAVMDPETGGLKCLKCEVSHKLDLPKDIEYVLAEMKVFSKKHSRCYVPKKAFIKQI